MIEIDQLGTSDEDIESLLDNTEFEISPSAPQPAKARPRRGRK